MDNIGRIISFYDINCSYTKKLWAWIQNTEFIRLPLNLNILHEIRIWHVHGHQATCFAWYVSLVMSTVMVTTDTFMPTHPWGSNECTWLGWLTAPDKYQIRMYPKRLVIIASSISSGYCSLSKPVDGSTWLPSLDFECPPLSMHSPSQRMSIFPIITRRD